MLGALARWLRLLDLDVAYDPALDDPELRACPDCGRIYWRGTHVERMRKRLAGWLGEEEAG
jgi:uncharacterized protein with PIN domain